MELKWGELPFEEMPERKRLIYLAYLAGFTYRDIAKSMKASQKFVSDCIVYGKEKYRIKRKAIYRLVEGRNSNNTLCEKCGKRETCTTPCERLQKELSSIETKKHDKTFTEYNIIEDLI